MWRNFAWLLLIVVLCACSGGQVRLPIGGPQTAATLLAALKVPPVQTLQGQARLDAYIGTDRRSVGLLVIAKRPNQLQFQALAPTLDMLALLSTDGKRFTSYERGGQQCLVGQACPANLARLLPIPLPGDKLVGALLGDVPLLDVPADQQVLGWDGERGLYRVTLGPSDGAHQILYIQPGTLRPVGAVWFQAQQRTASIQYDGQLGPGGPPKTIRVQASAQGSLPQRDMTIELRDVQVDQPIGAEAFEVACPDGMAVRELPCEDMQPPKETR